jgi:gamma-aminobutyric acid receptor subunit beta
MVVLSWAVFLIEARDLSNQVPIAITTILTVITFAFAISATMPRVPYLTYIDEFFLAWYVFVALVELMLVHLSHRRERSTDLGIRIQRISRWTVPLAFLVTNLILFEHFLG